MTTAFKAARVLPNSAAEVIENGVVIIREAEIEKVGSWQSLKDSLAADVKVRDLGDVTLMPGLFDCHMHLQMDPTGMLISSKVTKTDAELSTLVRKHALRLLDAGITTARDLGSRGQTVIELRDAIKAGKAMGPRLQCANAPVTVFGGHAHAMGGECSGVDGVRAMVRKRAAEGADVIKVMSTGGFMTAGTHPSRARFTQEEMDAIKDEAKKFNLPVTTHATGTEGIDRAAEAGFDMIEHCAWINLDGHAKFDPAVAQKIKDREIGVCPTMNTACVHDHYFCPWDSRTALISNLKAMRAFGLKLIMGTDSGIGLCRFERYADGLTVLSDAGYTPRELVAAATDAAAEACGLSSVTGKLAPGLAADLAAFEGNPLEDVQMFFKPRFVMANGREHELTPIAPIGDKKEAEEMTFKLLRKGAGMEEIDPVKGREAVAVS